MVCMARGSVALRQHLFASLKDIESNPYRALYLDIHSMIMILCCGLRIALLYCTIRVQFVGWNGKKEKEVLLDSFP